MEENSGLTFPDQHAILIKSIQNPHLSKDDLYLVHVIGNPIHVFNLIDRLYTLWPLIGAEIQVKSENITESKLMRLIAFPLDQYVYRKYSSIPH